MPPDRGDIPRIVSGSAFFVTAAKRPDISIRKMTTIVASNIDQIS